MKEDGRLGDRSRDDVAAVQAQLSKVAARIRMIQQRTEQLSALRADEGRAAAQIATLERVLEFDRVAAHVRHAATLGQVVPTPIAHLRAPNLLPDDVYRALIDLIPADVFFDGRAEPEQDLRVPPRLAPTAAIVAWRFVNDVMTVLSELLIARLAEPLAAYTRVRFPSLPPFHDWDVEVTLTKGRIVRRTSGYSGAASADRDWDLITGVLDLARADGNRLVASVGAAGEHLYASTSSHAPANLERYTYEFGIGPTRDARRTLTALMAKTT